MKRRQLIRTTAAVGAIGTGAVSPTVARGPPPGHGCRLAWRNELSSRTPDHEPIVNVTQDVVNDIDNSENSGTFWAVDDYHRLLRIWDVGGGEFRLLAQYNGSFDAIDGQPEPGPGATGTLDGDEDGQIQAGYIATVIDGSILSDPNRGWPTHGYVGEVDYEGDPETGATPGYVNWFDVYFEGTSWWPFEFDWRGFVYRGGRNGTWVNRVNGPNPEDCGNIS